MKAINHKHGNDIIGESNSSNDKVKPLHVARLVFDNDVNGIESCWELESGEIEEIIKTGKIYLLLLDVKQPPVKLSIKSIID